MCVYICLYLQNPYGKTHAYIYAHMGIILKKWFQKGLGITRHTLVPSAICWLYRCATRAHTYEP